MDRGLAIDWADLMGHKRGFTDPVPDNLQQQLAGKGVDTFHGTATLAAEDHLAVDGTPYAFRHVLVATGARPRPLDVPAPST